MGMTVRISRFAAAVLALSLGAAAAILGPEIAGAQSVAAFYAGKQINFIVGATPGGGYDTQARLVARHWGRHIPGNPTIVVQNMPAAGSLAATNHIYNVAARDGTVIALVQRGMLLVKNWNPTAVRFDLARLNWIGSINSEVAVTVAWHTAPHKTARDLLDQELIVGGQTGVDPETTPRLFNALLGTRFKIITGYPGVTEIILAMERGELQGLGDWSWSSMKMARPDWIRDRKVTLLMQASLQPEPELAGVPSAFEFVRNETDRSALELYLTQKTVARPLIAPPGVPPDRLAALRSGFIALVRDRDFLADAQTAKLDVAPVAGEAVDKVVALIAGASPQTAERVGKAIASPER
jgi:hypothetical protein